MKLMGLSILASLFLSMGACYRVDSTPVQAVTPEETLPMMTSTPAMTTVPSISPTEKVLTPTMDRLSGRATETIEGIQEIPMPIKPDVTITIVFDNNTSDQRLRTAWGFSALVEYQDHTLLFDTGDDGYILLENMRILGIDPAQIDSVVLSHAHQDHTGGLMAILETGARPMVYLLSSFPASFKHEVERYTQVGEVLPGQSLAEGFYTTGELRGTVPEQALVVHTKDGLVIVTGCAHPGIVAIVEQARAMFAEPVRLVVGGFHLGSKSEVELDGILKDFRRLDVMQVAPCHCTGENATSKFAAEYQDDLLVAGAGKVIQLDVAR